MGRLDRLEEMSMNGSSMKLVLNRCALLSLLPFCSPAICPVNGGDRGISGFTILRL